MSFRDSAQLHHVVRTSASRTYHVSRAAADLALTAGRAHQQRGVAVVGTSASVALKYKNLKTAAGFQTTPVEERLFRLAGDVATISGGVLAAVALPTMAKKTATSFRELTDLIHNPTATAEARLNKLEEMARSSAGTVFSAQGVVAGAKGTMGILSRSEGVARVAANVGNARWFRWLGSPLGKALNILLPVADVAVLVGETIATRRTFLDQDATSGQKARKTLDLTLATLKTAFWLLPAARPLKAIYAAASFMQLGLALKDFWPTVQPALASATRNTIWAVKHPVEATRALGTALETHTRGLGATMAAGAQALWKVVSNPGATWNTVTTTVRDWLGVLRMAPPGTESPTQNPENLGVPAAPLLPAASPSVAPAATPSMPTVQEWAPPPVPAPLEISELPIVPLPAPPPPPPLPGFLRH